MSPAGLPSILWTQRRGCVRPTAPAVGSECWSAPGRAQRPPGRCGRLRGLSSGELGPLESPQDAARWLEVVGRAASTGKLTHQQGRTIATTVREWLRAWDSGQVAEELERLRQQVTELKGKRKLEQVK